MEKKYIIATNYFNQSRIWIMRGVRILIAIIVLYLIDLQELNDSSTVLVAGSVFAALLVILALVWPTDEVALDERNVYLIRKSPLPVFNRSIEYDISNFKRVGIYNIAKAPNAFTLFVPMWDLQRIEIIFKDDSSLSHDLMIPKKGLKKVLMAVQEKITA